VFFEMEASAHGPFRPDEEVDALEWLPALDAEKRLTHPSEGAVLREAARMRKQQNHVQG
jgi:hypothetical protein